MSEAAPTPAGPTVYGPGGVAAGWRAHLFPPSSNRGYAGSMASAYILSIPILIVALAASLRGRGG